MRFYYRVYLWPIALIAFCTVAGVCVFIGRYPWVSAGLLVAALALCAVGFEDRRGVWPWQVFSRSNPEYDLDAEPADDDGFVTDLLTPYREKISDTQQ